MMQKKPHIQSPFTVKISQWLKITLLSSVMLYPPLLQANTSQPQPKPSYYRYYDNSGRVTISRNVSPEHIRHGYEVLDRNMYMIKKVPAYNVENDLKQESKRAVQHQQTQRDLQIKRSYRNVKYATDKKNDALKVIQKQISENYLRMKTLQTDRAKLLTEKADLIFNRKPVPSPVQKKLDENEAQIKQIRQNIEMLKNQLGQQEAFYNGIIKRLQTME